MKLPNYKVALGFAISACSFLLLSGCCTVSNEPPPHTELTYLGETDGDGYRYHVFKRSDGTVFIEQRGKTMELAQ